MTVDVTVSLLGPVEARRPSGPVPMPGLKMQALLALLALSAPAPVSDGRLIDELWGDETLSNPSNSLHSQVAILRRAVGRDAVVRSGLGYSLAVDPDDIDAWRFVRLVERSRELAREGDNRSAAQGFQTAIELVRGPPLGDLIDYPFGRENAVRLGEVLLDAHEGRADAELALGRHADLVGPLSELVRMHPLRERFHAQLIRALYRCGRQADALRAFGAARSMLIDELGLEPGPELRNLELAVLSHDAALAVPFEQQVPPPSVSAPADRGSTEIIETAGRDGSGLVGRDMELGWLRSDLVEAIASRGRIALLAGEPGIGKSRLADELAADATIRGAVVAWGRCYAGRGAPAFWPWSQIVQALIEQIPADVMIAALGRGAADVGQLVPEIHELLPTLDTPAPLGPEFERFRLCDALTRSMRRLAATRPLVIVLEDLQWADASSLEMLSFVAAEILEAPILIVATYRSVGARGSASLAETLADLARQPMVRRVDMSGLGLNAVRTLMDEVGLASDDDVVRAVHRRTQGNPFFLAEILRLRLTSGDPRDLDAVPSGVRDVIRQRLGLLPDSTLEVMAAASVLGSDFELSILAASLGDDPANSLHQLEAAFAAGLISGTPDRPGRYQFSHVLVRDTLYEELGVARRGLLHRKAAEAIEMVHGVVEGSGLFVLAEHWFRAVPVAPPDRGVELALKAARWGKEHVAHGEAEEQLRAALALLETMPEGARRSQLELEVQYELSVLLLMTVGYAAPGVDLACSRMRELCSSIDDEALLMPALWRLAMFALLGNDLDTAIGLARQLLELGSADRNPGPLLAGHMMLGSLHTNRGELATARAHLDRAQELCRCGHANLVAPFVAETPALWIAAMSAWNWELLGDEERADLAVGDALAAAGAAAEPAKSYAMTYAIWIGSVVATLRRDVAATQRLCEEGIALATTSGYALMFVPFMSAHLGWAEALAGEPDLGIPQIEAGAASVAATGTGAWGHVFLALLADAHLAAGRFAQALQHADDGLSRLGPPETQWFEAELHRLRGEALCGIGGADGDAAAEFALAVDIAGRQGAVCLRRRADASLRSHLGG